MPSRSSLYISSANFNSDLTLARARLTFTNAWPERDLTSFCVRAPAVVVLLFVMSGSVNTQALMSSAKRFPRYLHLPKQEKRDSGQRSALWGACLTLLHTSAYEITIRPMNRAAQQLGRLARGKPKYYSRAEIKKRTKRLAEARKKRWPRRRR